MFIDPLHEYYIEGDELKSCCDLPSVSAAVYEVIRIINGRPIFLKEHLDRLQNSYQLFFNTANKLACAKIKQALNKLIHANRVSEGNIRIELDQEAFHKAYFIAHHYPGITKYVEGVPTEIRVYTRKLPSIKTFHREMPKPGMAFGAPYEYLLADESGYITEGSKSNVFFIKNQEVFTAPLTMVLAGITREKLIQLMDAFNIKCNTRAIHRSMLQQFESAFLTGTSPKVLPIQSIDQIRFNPIHPITQSLMKAYDRLIQEEIMGFRW